MSEGARRIAVVGGGTAGWLAALMLRRASGADGPQIAVVESPDIPTVGVGEGSTSVFRQLILDLGIDERVFLRETGATIKYGIRHEGWRADGGSYFGPIDDPSALAPPPAGAPANWLSVARVGRGKPVAQLHLFDALAQLGRAPMAEVKGRQIAVSPFHHAYHFDQARLGRFLAAQATGIEHVRAEVEGLDRDPETGAVTALQLKGRASLPVSFVIDCTGFRRAVIGAMEPGWRSYGDMLPLDRAMTFWRDHGEGEIAPVTTARALGAGWMWGIPTRERMGCGYVFSSAHTDPDAARAEVEAALGHPIEPRGVLTIAPGRLGEAWRHNVVALGLSQSFLEPLEATSIHGTIVQAMLLLRTAPEALCSADRPEARERYNREVARQVDDFAEFINLHYAGGRSDTPFWRDMTGAGLSERTRARLAHWRRAPVVRADFAAFPRGLPHVEEQLHLPVLDGLGLLPQGPSKAAAAPFRRAARETSERLTREFRTAARKALPHRAWLEGIAGEAL